jgi:deoxyribodipyrimidine photo-lyase
LADNTALLAAARDSAGEVVPLFVLDDDLLKGKYVAPARVAFMLDCLRELDAALREIGSQLIVRRGKPEQEVLTVAQEAGAGAVYFNRDYTPAARARDQRVSDALQASSIRVESFRDLVIFEEDELLTGAGKPYTVFTPYKRAWLSQLGNEEWRMGNTPALKSLEIPHSILPIPNISDLGFNVTQRVPKGGERKAMEILTQFKGSGAMEAYSTNRDFPAIGNGTSHLSPYLRMGAISPRQCLAAAMEALPYEFPQKKSFSPASSDDKKHGADAWISELIWRDFYQQILFNFPHVKRDHFNKAYANLRYGTGDRHDDEALVGAWKAGKTGFPIVDAAMRQMNSVTWMHNRCRMIVASFLTKDLLQDWRVGERHFMSILVDGDPAANNGGWQWAASTGTDAQPYFRVFNPRLQSERYDPHGDYIRQWIPELKNVPNEYIHAPAEMPPLVQEQAGCIIGEHYPEPIVSHALQKDEVLRRFQAVRD